MSATRTDRGIEDQPMRVEVVDREEIDEKIMMTPGDVVMLLNETGGMRVQATSPSLGAASIRIQGMRGRYTRFLSDGLPLFGEQVSLGLMQIPPLDLGRVGSDQGRRFLAVRRRCDEWCGQSRVEASRCDTRASGFVQRFARAAPRMRGCGIPRRCPSDGASRCSAARTDRCEEM